MTRLISACGSSATANTASADPMPTSPSVRTPVGLFVQLTIEAKRTANEHRGAEPKHDICPAEHGAASPIEGPYATPPRGPCASSLSLGTNGALAPRSPRREELTPSGIAVGLTTLHGHRHVPTRKAMHRNAKHWSSRAKRPSLTETAARQTSAACVNARCRGARARDRASPGRSGDARPPPSRRRRWQRPAA
jgi:hypothetical protein